MKGMKILLTVILSFVLILLPLSVNAVSYQVDGFENVEIDETVLNDGEWFYTVDEADNTATILAYNGKDKDAVIPQKIDGKYKVTKLCLASNLISVDGFNTFFPVFNAEIESLSISETLELITSSKDPMFYEENLKNDELTHKGKTIVNTYFMGGNLPKLKSITVDKANPYFASNGGVLYNKDKTVLIVYPPNKPDAKFTLPKTVKTVMDHAFSPMPLQLKEFVITENLATIGVNNIFNSHTTNLAKISVFNNKLGEKQLKNIFANELLDITNDDSTLKPVTVTVYKNSPAYKYYAKREKLVVKANPFIEEKPESKPESQVSSKNESVVSSQVTESKEESTVSQIEPTPKEEPQKPLPKANDKWIIPIISVVALLLLGGALFVVCKRKR